MSAADKLYGTWRLVSWRRRLLDTDEAVEPFGGSPHGVLHYGRDGRMFFVATHEDRTAPADPARLTDAERARLYDTMAFYAGTFTFDGEVARHTVDLSWNESWNGSEQVRNVKFEAGRLILSASIQKGLDGRPSDSVLVWERAD